MTTKQDISTELEILHYKYDELGRFLVAYKDFAPALTSASNSATLQEATDLIEDVINLLKSINF